MCFYKCACHSTHAHTHNKRSQVLPSEETVKGKKAPPVADKKKPPAKKDKQQEEEEAAVPPTPPADAAGWDLLLDVSICMCACVRACVCVNPDGGGLCARAHECVLSGKLLVAVNCMAHTFCSCVFVCVHADGGGAVRTCACV